MFKYGTLELFQWESAFKLSESLNAFKLVSFTHILCFLIV